MDNSGGSICRRGQEINSRLLASRPIRRANERILLIEEVPEAVSVWKGRTSIAMTGTSYVSSPSSSSGMGRCSMNRLVRSGVAMMLLDVIDRASV